MRFARLKLQWAGHVVRKDVGRQAIKVLHGKILERIGEFYEMD